MTTKLTKEDLKNPDQFKQGLESSMTWLSKNLALVGILFGVFVAAGAGWSAWDYMQSSKEEKLMGELSLAEKDYFEKKSKFDEAKRAEDMKKANPAAAAAAKKEDKPAEMATGDLQKDYGTFVEKFSDLVSRAPKSKAGAMAAMYLAEMYIEHKQPEKALESLQNVSAGDKARDILSALALNMKAGLIADKGDCKGAVSIWENVVSQKKVAYLHDEAKLRMALCYEQMNDNAKAEQLYTELSKPSEDPEMDRVVAEDAKKYLRLMKVRTSGGT